MKNKRLETIEKSVKKYFENYNGMLVTINKNGLESMSVEWIIEDLPKTINRALAKLDK